MRTRIFSCHHRTPVVEHQNRLFAPILSGSHSGTGHIGDLDGVNIAGNSSLSEIRHHYFVWKNLLADYDYVGFEHYRRKFFINPFPRDEIGGAGPRGGELVEVSREVCSRPLAFVHRVAPETFDAYSALRNGFDDVQFRRIEYMVENCDVILPVVMDVPVRDWWIAHHGNWDFGLIEDAVRANGYFRHREVLIDFEAARNQFWNMFVMRTDMFDDYMSFLFDCLSHVLARIEDGPRVTGYFCERFFSLWIYQKQREDGLLRVGRLPVIEYV